MGAVTPTDPQPTIGRPGSRARYLGQAARLDCITDSVDFQSYGDSEDEFFRRYPSDATLLLRRYGHRWRDDHHKSTQYSMSAYLASRLRELANEGQLELRFLPARDPWTYNGVISHWRRPLPPV